MRNLRLRSNKIRWRLERGRGRAAAELDMDWIHPRIGLDWVGLDWIGSFCVIHFVDWIGLGPMEKNRPNRVAS